MQDYLSGFNVRLSVGEFTSVTSNIYHSYEARNYDERHFSIEYSKKYWSKVTRYLSKYFENKQQVSVLDFGCGTGFATERLLLSGLNSQINRLSCYDLSEDMVAVCRQKFGADPRLSFFSNDDGRETMLATKQKYDIIVCNALMHHILEPEFVFALINELLEPGGIFVMGHEPNKRFYNNSILQSASKIFRVYKKINRRLFGKKRKTTEDIAVLTQKELVQKGMVPVDFPVTIIPKFVDIHVPLSNYAVQPWGENGFDLAYVNHYLASNFGLIAQITYSHIKDQEAYKSFVWRNIAGLLAKVYPKDGADAIFVFKKKETQIN